ncbi:MAG TPA: hypothetical protein LFW21_00070 [Rickettsia endosymbiont of Pyrocoelia pectoralis]|nr:hypothetical protein [Rickettsia endosymbiont of Pyrocoelia pectoralis]
MSKTDGGRYLDKDKTLLYTANNLYKQALQGFNNTKILETHENLTPLVKGGYIAARSELTQALLFGKFEACSGLALFNQQGIGGQ